jgi:NAD(P)H-nitrite reductase large subunit
MGERTDGLPDARRLDDLIAGSRVPFPVRIGFSGCSSNCGEALTRDIGVVRMEGGQYDIFIGGRPGSLTPRIAEQVAAGVAAADLPAVVAALLETYRQMARGKERLWKNVARVGTDPYRQAAGQTRT